ncbi:MAG TPA: hypothetical protein VF221_16145 [Chloroflexota bacterium]
MVKNGSPRLRRIVSAALLLVGTLAMLAAVLDIYAWTAIVDSAGLQRHVQQARRDPAVQEALADVIVRRAIEHASPDVVAARPLLKQLVAGLLGSALFDPVFRQATAELHRSLFSPGHTIVFDVADSGVLLSGVLRAYAPQIADRIPEELTNGTLVLAQNPPVPPFFTSAGRVQLLGIVLPLLAATLFVLALIVGPNPRRIVTAMGVAWCIVAGLLSAGILIGRQVLVGAVSDQGGSIAAAAGAAWDIFVDPLWSWILILTVAGAILILSAYRRDVGSMVSAGLRRATVRPTSVWGTVWRAAVLLVVGVALILSPLGAIRVGLIAGGLFCVVWATGEVLRLLDRDSTHVEATTALPQPARSRSSRGRAVAGVIVVVGLVGAGELQLGGGEQAVATALDVRVCNGYAQLCDRRITAVAFAATHNSMSAASEPGWYNAAHHKGITAQLDYGVRAFLIDTHYGVPNRRGRVQTDLSFEGKKRAKLVQELGEPAVAAAERLLGGPLGYNGPASARRPYLCHFLCELGATPFVPALVGIRQWLERHPHEVIVLIIEDDISPEDTAAAFQESGLLPFVYTHPQRAAWPTLREMIATNHRALVMAENNNGHGRYPWYNDAFSITQETPYDAKSVAALTCAPNRGGADLPFFLLNHWVAKEPPSVTDAEKVNARSFLLTRAEQCQRDRGHLPNFIAVNFYDRGAVLAVVDVLNRVPQTPAS